MSLEDIGTERSEVTTERIPREAWEQFLNSFSEFNLQVPVRIEAVGSAGAAAGLMVEHLPLLDLTLDDAAGDPVILIECGFTEGSSSSSSTSPGRESAYRHTVNRPTTLWARKRDPAGWDAIEILSDDGAVIITLRPDDPSPRNARDEVHGSGVAA